MDATWKLRGDEDLWSAVKEFTLQIEFIISLHPQYYWYARRNYIFINTGKFDTWIDINSGVSVDM